MTLECTYSGLPVDTYGIAWSHDGSYLAAVGGSAANQMVAGVGKKPTIGNTTANLWSVAGREMKILYNYTEYVESLAIAWHPSDSILAFGGRDGDVHVVDIKIGGSHEVVSLDKDVRGTAWSPDGALLAITYAQWSEGNPEKGREGWIGLWDAHEHRLTKESRIDHYANIPCWSPDGLSLILPGSDGALRVFDRELNYQSTYHGHSDTIFYADISADGMLIASGSRDATVRVWNPTRSSEIAVLENQFSARCVKFSPDAELLASTTQDKVRIWRCRDWECVTEIPVEGISGLGGIAFHPLLPKIAIKDNGQNHIACYDIDRALLGTTRVRASSRRYANAKVVLLGDTGVGKSGLGLVLSQQPYAPTDSTHGRRVWTFTSDEVDIPPTGKQTREVLLWDLAGQPGYRLIHQLHLNEVAVALLVFDSRSEVDPFAGIKHWVRALAQARRLEETAVPLKAYLVSARADRGGVAVSRDRIKAMVSELGLNGFFETSAKENWQITELADAIRESISWDTLPMVSSSALFDSIKRYLLEEKQQGRVLCTADDLFRGFLRTHHDENDRDQLRVSFETCIGRVESRDLIRRLRFGDLVLLQPELLDAYASALVQAAKDEPDGLGFITEEDALNGNFRLAAEERISEPAQEKLLMIATIEELLRHEIALKETTDQGVDLVFPSQFTRERPGAPDIPGRTVTFTFEGPLYSIYASLAVRLAHSSLFRRQTMWQNAASYVATVGGICGIQLRELEEGRGDLAVFYDEAADATVRAQFETYVAEHLQQRALPGTVTHATVRSCPECAYVLPDDLVRLKLQRGMLVSTCPVCESTTITLRDTDPSPQAEAAVSEMNRSADNRRDRSVATTRIQGKIQTGDYDVFLCHSSRDKPQIKKIGERLKERGILPWLDEWDIRPGTRWQAELRRNIRSVKSAAVFIGARGPGPWQEYEVESLLGEFAKHKKPLIPVILEGRIGKPRLPAFLSSWHMVDMRRTDPDPFDQLVWGITGARSINS